jgi:hypothetical protein
MPLRFHWRRRAIAAGLVLVLAPWVAPAQPLFQDWLRRLDHSPGRLDQVQAAAVDGVGNLYLAAVISTPVSGFDFLITKLNPSGQIVWQEQFNGTGNGSDIPASIQVDNVGEVYVTGASMSAGGLADIVTLRLGPSGGGSPAWPSTGAGPGVRRYNGAANGPDEGAVVRVDSLGFVHVTGKSVGAGSFADVVTIKYNQVGDTLWERRYNGPGNDTDAPVDLRTDGAGNVYVLAESVGGGGGTEWVFLKYDANGNASGDWPNTGAGLGVRRLANAATGFDARPSMVLDAAGNLYAAVPVQVAGQGANIALVKLQPNGQFAWTVTYNGPGNAADRPVAVQIDPTGDIVVAGTSTGATSGDDYLLLKYTPSGGASPSWPDGTGLVQGQRRIDGGGFSADVARAMVIDSSGAVIVTGQSFDNDFFTVKVTAAGQLAWTHRLDGGQNGIDSAQAALLDVSGNLFLAGNGVSATGDDDVLAGRFAVQPSSNVASPALWAFTPGRSVTLAPSYTGSVPLNFYWRKNGSILAGETAATLALNNVAAAHAGAYSLVLSNRAGLFTVNAAELAVFQLAVNPSAQATVHIDGVAGRNYRVDHTPEISTSPSWTELGTVPGAATTVTVPDPSPTTGHARRFYRVVPLP